MIIFNPIWIKVFEKTRKYEVYRSIFVCDYIRCTPKSLKNIELPSIKILKLIPSEGTVFSEVVCSQLDFEVTHSISYHKDSEIANLIDSVRLGSLVLFSEFILVTGCGKYLEHIASIKCLLYKLLPCFTKGDDFLTHFVQIKARVELELSDNKKAPNKNYF